MCYVPSLVEIGPVFWRRSFLNFVNVFSIYCYYLPWEKSVSFHLINFEFPLPKDALYQDWLKLALWFWRERFFKFCQCIFAYSFLSLLAKRCGPSFYSTWISYTQWSIVPSLVEIDPLVLAKKMKMWKVYNNNCNDNDDGQRTHFVQKSALSLEPWNVCSHMAHTKKEVFAVYLKRNAFNKRPRGYNAHLRNSFDQ